MIGRDDGAPDSRRRRPMARGRSRGPKSLGTRKPTRPATASVSEVQTADRIGESGARGHRAGMIEMRPVLVQLILLRQVAVVQNRTILLEKLEIADRLGAVEHRQE